MERHWQAEGAWNIRDLGGYPVPDGRHTQWGRLLRSDGLHRLSGPTVTELVGKGVKTVIDLRGAHETELHVNPFRDCAEVDYRNIPLFDGLSPVDLLSETAMAGYSLAERYVEALTACRSSFATVFATMANARDGLVMFHCTAGKDRTGLVAALTLAIVGVPQEHIISDYLLTATIAAPLLKRLRENALQRGAMPASVKTVLAVDPKAIAAALQYLAAHGGAYGYLRECGVDDARLQAICRRLLCNPASSDFD
jgi:protein-tyrosine phosphatase